MHRQHIVCLKKTNDLDDIIVESYDDERDLISGWIKEIKKSELSSELKNRLLSTINKTKNPNNKILKKKIDVDLSGYSIYINAFI